jgi:hypothetical protein
LATASGERERLRRRNLHYVEHPGEAELISAAFAVDEETEALRP